MQQEKIPTIISGAGLGGLSLYHALIKNKDKKEFNVKIFERETSPTAGLSYYGARSLLNCVPSSIASNLPKAIPNPIPDVETHGITITDQIGNYEKLPELQIVDYGITHVSANVSVPQHLMDKANKIQENFLVRKTLGTKEDSTLMMTRLIPIKQEQNDEKSEPHYRVTLVYSYPFELDNVDVESDKVKVDDNDPASVIEHVKRLIRTLRPD
ncbi:hypothetical protein RhiirA5_437963, partial [Rhizophagus irregularis]